MARKGSTRFEDLFTDSVPVRALEQVRLFLRCARGLRVAVYPEDFLKPGALQQAMRMGAQVTGWLPVSAHLIHEYASWLGRWKREDGELMIAIDKDISTEILDTGFHTATTRAQSKFLAITAHELGHVLMGHAKPMAFVDNRGRWLAAGWASLSAEAEAWLFAGFLRAFVFADIGGEKRPDEVHKYV